MPEMHPVIDFHSHILPGIDDGARDLDASLELARQAVADGVTHMLATPHAASHALDVCIACRDGALDALRNALRNAQIPLVILPGLEYFTDGNTLADALNDPRSCCGAPSDVPNTRPLLVELPLTADVAFAGNLLFQAQLKGVPVVLAHPERAVNFHSRLSELEALLERGLYLQFTAYAFRPSIFNRKLRKALERLIEAAPDRILVGSDAHHPVFRPAGMAFARRTVTDACGAGRWEQLVSETPARLLGL